MVDELGFNTENKRGSIWNQMDQETRESLNYKGFFSGSDLPNSNPFYVPFKTVGRNTNSYTFNNGDAYSQLHSNLINTLQNRRNHDQAILDVSEFNNRMLDRYRGTSRSETRQAKLQWIKDQGIENYDSNARDWSWKRIYKTYGQDVDVDIWRNVNNMHERNKPQQAIESYINYRSGNQSAVFFDLETFGSFNQNTGEINGFFMPYQASFKEARFVNGRVQKGSTRNFLIDPSQTKAMPKIQQAIDKLKTQKETGVTQALTDSEYRAVRDLIKIGDADVKNGEIKNLPKWVDDVLPEGQVQDLSAYLDKAEEGLLKLTEEGNSPEELIKYWNDISEDNMVAGHNVANYDIPGLKLFATNEGLGIHDTDNYFDTMQLFRSVSSNPEEDIYGGKNPTDSGDLTLDALRSRYNLESTDAHTASYDIDSLIDVLDEGKDDIDSRLNIMLYKNNENTDEVIERINKNIYELEAGQKDYGLHSYQSPYQEELDRAFEKDIDKINQLKRARTSVEDAAKRHDSLFSIDNESIRTGDILFAQQGQHAYREAAADMVLEKDGEDLIKKDFPKVSVRKKSYYRVSDSFEDQGMHNLVLENLSTEDVHVISRENKSDLQNYVQKMFNYEGRGLDEDELAEKVARANDNYLDDLARTRYRKLFSGEDRSFRNLKMFYDAVDIEDESALREHFNSEQQLRDFNRMRDRLESEADVVRPALQEIENQYGRESSYSDKAVIQVKRKLDMEFGPHKENANLLDFERKGIDIPTFDGGKTSLNIPDFETGSKNLWWTVYNETKGRDKRAREIYMNDILNKLERDQVITSQKRARLQEKQNIKYQIEGLIDDLMRNDSIDKAENGLKVDSLKARESMLKGDEAVQKGRKIGSQTVEFMNKTMYEGDFVQSELDRMSKEASRYLPEGFDYDFNQNVKDISAKLTAQDGVGYSISFTDNGNLMLAVADEGSIEEVERGLLRGRPSKKAAYLEIPMPDEKGLLRQKSITKTPQGYIKRDWRNPGQYHLRTTSDEIVQNLTYKSRLDKVSRYLEEGDIDSVQKELNRAVNSVLEELPDTSKGTTTTSSYTTVADALKQTHINASEMGRELITEMGIDQQDFYRDQLAGMNKGQLDLHDLRLADQMKVIKEMPDFIERKTGIKVNAASIKGSHISDAKFATEDVRTLKPLSPYSAATRPNPIQMQRHYQLEDSALDLINRTDSLSVGQDIVTDQLRAIEDRYDMKPSSVSMNVALTDNITLEQLYQDNEIDKNFITQASTYENTAVMRESQMELFNARQVKSMSMPDVAPENIEYSNKVMRALDNGEEVAVEPKEIIAKYIDDSGLEKEIRYTEENRGVISNVDLTPGKERLEIAVERPGETSMKLDVEGEKVTVIPMADETMDKFFGKDISMAYASNIEKHEDFGAPIIGQINRIMDDINKYDGEDRATEKRQFIRRFNDIFGQDLTEDNFTEVNGRSVLQIDGDLEKWKKEIDPTKVQDMLDEWGISEVEETSSGRKYIKQRQAVGRQIVDEHERVMSAYGRVPSWDVQDVGVKFGPRQTFAVEELWGFKETAKYIRQNAGKRNGDIDRVARGSWNAIQYMIEGTPEFANPAEPEEFKTAVRGVRGYTEDTLQGTVISPDEGTSRFMKLPEELTIDDGAGNRVSIDSVFMPERDLGKVGDGRVELDKIQGAQTKIHDLAMEMKERRRVPDGQDVSKLRSFEEIRMDMKRTVENYYSELSDSIAGKESDIAKGLTSRMPASGHGKIRIMSPTVKTAESTFTESDWNEILQADEDKAYDIFQAKRNKYERELGEEILEENTIYISKKRAKELATDRVSGKVSDKLLRDMSEEGVYGLGIRYPMFFKEAAQPVKIKTHKDVYKNDMFMTAGTADILNADSDGDKGAFVLMREFIEGRTEDGEQIFERTEASRRSEDEIRDVFRSKEQIRRRFEQGQNAARDYINKTAGTNEEFIRNLDSNIRNYKADGNLQTLDRLVPDGVSGFQVKVGGEAENAIMHAKLGKKGIGYLSNINMKIKQLAKGVENKNSRVFNQLFNDIDTGPGGAFGALEQFGTTLEQNFIDVKHDDLDAAFGKDQAAHISMDVGSAINRGDFDFLRSIKSKQTGEAIFDETSLNVAERFHSAMKQTDTWYAPETKAFLSTQMKDYGGGAAGVYEMLKGAQSGDTAITPYLEDILGATGVSESVDSKVINQLKNIKPQSVGDSVAKSAINATPVGATTNTIEGSINKAAKSAVGSTKKLLKGTGLVAAVGAGAYAVSHFLRDDPITPESMPQHNEAPDVTGNYESKGYKVERQRQQEEKARRPQGNKRVNTDSNQAYVQNNQGKNIKIKGSGNVDTERVSSLIQQEMERSGRSGEINLNINDNTSEINNQWMQEKVAAAMNDGYVN